MTEPPNDDRVSLQRLREELVSKLAEVDTQLYGGTVEEARRRYRIAAARRRMRRLGWRGIVGAVITGTGLGAVWRLAAGHSATAATALGGAAVLGMTGAAIWLLPPLLDTPERDNPPPVPGATAPAGPSVPSPSPAPTTPTASGTPTASPSPSPAPGSTSPEPAPTVVPEATPGPGTPPVTGGTPTLPPGTPPDTPPAEPPAEDPPAEPPEPDDCLIDLALPPLARVCLL